MAFNFGEEETQGTQAGVVANADAAGLTFDLGAVEETSSFEVLPKGTYAAIVEEFELTESQSSGVPMIKAVYSIVEGEFAERKIFDYYVLGGEGAKYALPKLKQLLLRTCPEYNISSFNPEAFCNEGTIINRACQLVLGIQTQKKGDYKGEKRNNVKEILAATTSAGSFLG